MSRAYVRAELRENLAIMAVLSVLAVSLAIDLVLDLGRRTSVFHARIEGAAIVAAAVGFGLGALRFRSAVREAQDLRAPRPASAVAASSNAPERSA